MKNKMRKKIKLRDFELWQIQYMDLKSSYGSWSYVSIYEAIKILDKLYAYVDDLEQQIKKDK